MTAPNIEELRKLAEECQEIGIDFEDVSPQQGSTFCNKLTREYIEAVSPVVITELLDQLQSQAERIKELEGGVTHWKALREAAVNVANDRREERDTLAADNARLRTLVIGLQTDAERYRHAKLYDLLDGWDDESIDRDIRIHNLVVNAAIKGGV